MPACARKLTTREAANLAGWPYHALHASIERGLVKRPAAEHKPGAAFQWVPREVCALRTCRAVWERTGNMDAAARAMILIADISDDQLDAAFARGCRYLLAIDGLVWTRLMSHKDLTKTIEGVRADCPDMDMQTVVLDVERAMELTRAAITSLPTGRSPRRNLPKTEAN